MLLAWPTRLQLSPSPPPAAQIVDQKGDVPLPQPPLLSQRSKLRSGSAAWQRVQLFACWCRCPTQRFVVAVVATRPKRPEERPTAAGLLVLRFVDRTPLKGNLRHWNAQLDRNAQLNSNLRRWNAQLKLKSSGRENLDHYKCDYNAVGASPLLERFGRRVVTEINTIPSNTPTDPLRNAFSSSPSTDPKH